ncbi:UNVERIFIED_CONTAM: uncharacterized protein DUF3558 [Williamsia faeni]
MTSETISKGLWSVSAVLLVAACSVQAENTEALPGPAELQTQIPRPSISLPFDNPFPDRTNQSNDGSVFEPCIAYDDSELIRFDIDPKLIEDVAIVNGQGIRGCKWVMPERFSLSVAVTNSNSLEEYRSGAIEYNWMTDLELGERTVGYFELDHGFSKACLTYVQSANAGVVTKVVTYEDDNGPVGGACELVANFTRAYIDKIPE